MKVKFYIILFSFITILSACEDDTTKKNELTIPFNQAALLQNLSAQYIVPSYQDLQVKTSDFKIAVDSFILNQDTAGLFEVKAKLKDTYIAWQKVSFLSFGPAADQNLKSNINVFPTDASGIESAISQGNVDLDNLSSKTIKGLPALDYLLNGDPIVIAINRFRTGSNRRAFLSQLSIDLENRVNQVAMEWNTYQASFNSQSGTSVGSSVGLSINALNEHYERFFRDGKLGIPLGVRSSGISRPQDAESYYGAYSFELMRANFMGMKEFYTGLNGIGFDDYLVAADAEDLDALIKTQMVLIESQLNGFNGSLEIAIINRSSELQNLYNEMQKLIVYWKVDMPSRLGVLISYQDNDGD